MALYWSSSQGFINTEERKSAPPKTYYSPSQGTTFQSFDGRTVAPQSDTFDPSAKSDIQSKIQDFLNYRERQSQVQHTSDLSPENAQTYRETEAAGGQAGNKPKESFLDRTIDVISRSLYAVANPIKQRAANERGVEERLKSQLTPAEKKADYLAKGNAFNDFVNSIFDDRQEKQDKRSIRKKREKIEELPQFQRDFQDDLTASWRGFTGKDKTTFADVIEAHDPYAPDWAKASFGFAGDVVLDPLNLVPGYALTKPFTASAKAIRGVTSGGRAERQVAESLSKQGEDLRSSFAEELEEGVLDSQLFDRVVSTDVKITGAQRITAARDLSKQLAGEYSSRKFSDFFETNLQEAVRAGRVSQGMADSMLGGPGFASLEDAVQGARQAVNARRGVPETSGSVSSTLAPEAVSGAREGARSFVRDMMERGRLNQAIGEGRRSGVDAASVRPQLGELNKRLKDVDLDISPYLNVGKLKALHHSSGTIKRWSNGLVRQIEEGKAVGSQKVQQSLNSVFNATDGKLKYAITRALGAKSNAATREISRVLDDYVSVTARPAKENRQAYEAWHAGLFETLSRTLNDSVVDDVAEQIARDNPGKFDEYQSISSEVKPTPKLDEAAQKLGPPETRELKELIKEAEEHAFSSVKEMEETILELVAKADKLGLDKATLRSSKALDENLDRVANRETPLLAERSFNKAVEGFNNLFRAKAGLDPRIDEMRLRYMGSANEMIRHKAKQVEDLFKGTGPKQRVAEWKSFHKLGVDESGRIQGFMDEMRRILEPYKSKQSSNAFGPAGALTLGDLSRWLPDKYKIPSDVLRSGEDINQWEDIADFVIEGGAFGEKAKSIDPMEFLWSFMVANEKALTEKATLHSIAETFGVPKGEHSLAGSALTSKRSGYTTVPNKFGDEVYFHPEVARQIDKFFELVHSPRATNALVGFLDSVHDNYKQLVTIFNPAGFNVRNSMGDAYTGYLDGVSGARGLASYRQSSKALGIRKRMEEGGDVPEARQSLFRLRGGQSVSTEETVALYNKHGLNTGLVQTDPSFLSDPSMGGSIRRGARSVKEPFQKLAEVQADYFRYAHFIDRMKRSKSKDLNEAAQEAAESVRRFKFDYNDFTPFEKTVLSRVIPFYKFTRKNLPLMTAMLLTRPAKFNIAPKTLTALSTFMGFESDGFRPDYDATDVMPEWLRDRGAWPIAEHAGDVIFARPDVQMFDLFDAAQQGPAWATDQLSPAINIPIEQATGQEFFNYETRPLKNKDDPIAYLMQQLPQTRYGKEISEGKTDPGNIGKILGFGTEQVTDPEQANELGVRQAKFFNSPEGQNYLDNPPPKEISAEQIQYLLSLIAQQNAPIRR